MDVPRTSFLEFIGAEQTNLLVTLTKCHHDIADIFPHLDGVYQAPFEFIDINTQDEHKKTILSLCLFTHYQLYFSTVCHLRCHLSDSLGSTRKAIDATLTAYRLIAEPDTLSQYHDSHSDYQHIKSYVAKQMQLTPTSYPLAAELIKFHELCSEFGSHTDISSFVHRVSVEHSQEAGKGLVKVNMFQKPETDIELRAYLVRSLLAYSQMAKVFSSFIGELAIGLDLDAWNKKIDELIHAFATEVRNIDRYFRDANIK